MPSGLRLSTGRPAEWNIRDAFVEDARGKGRRLPRSNLHVVSYSVPVPSDSHWTELAAPLHAARPSRSHPLPDLVLRGEAGLLPHAQRPALLEDGDYEVCIDSSLEPGSLTYGEVLSPDRATKRCCLVPRMPPFARQRQPVRYRAGHFLARCSAPVRCATRTGSCSSPAQSDRSSGRSQRGGVGGSGTAWWSRASATPRPSPTS